MDGLMVLLVIVGLVVGTILILFLFSLPANIFRAAPNEVLIISGRRRRSLGEGRRVGYRIIKGGMTFRWPLLERVDRMDLTNMVIDLTAQNAYSKGGIPLTVQGVANVKIAGHEPILNNAIERFLDKSRLEIMQIAKATLEGALRGVLATLTPEEVNEDKIKFAEMLVHEVETDMTSLGLVVDTMKIQNVHDDVKYLDSIGRKKSAEVVSTARKAEAKAQADSIVRSAENLERETKAQIDAQVQIAKADAHKRLTDAQTRRDALIAEELAIVAAQVAQAKAEVDVQKARVEQVRRRLEADVIAPARADAEAAEAEAKASTAHIIEDGRARAEALKKLAASWEQAGPSARNVVLMQKLDSVIDAISTTIADKQINKVTMIDGRSPSLGDGSGNGSFPLKAYGTLQQIKDLTGLDIVEKLQNVGAHGEKPRRPASQPPPDGTVQEGEGARWDIQ
jgi:flotillin